MKYLMIFTALVFWLKPIWPVAEYILNYDYIAHELCVNKDKPGLHCNGKCYLTTQLAEEAGTDHNHPKSSFSSKIEISGPVYMQEIPEFNFNNSLEEIENSTPLHRGSLYSFLYTTNIKHPPRLG